jgi:hypothetical protein
MSAETVAKKNDATNEPMVEYTSGARRSAHMPDYALIPHSGMRRLAERYSLGLKKYGANNWKLGLRDPEYVEQFKDHIVEHLWNYFEKGCSEDDNLAAIAWGVFALMEAERVAAEDAAKQKGQPIE